MILSLFLSVFAQAQSTALDGLSTENALAQMQKIERENLWIETLSAQDLTTLPIGIKSQKRGDNTSYSIGIIKADFYPEYTELQVFAKIDIPQKDENGRPVSLLFGANNIKLSHGGGIIGEAKLALLSDISITISKNAWNINLYVD